MVHRQATGRAAKAHKLTPFPIWRTSVDHISCVLYYQSDTTILLSSRCRLELEFEIEKQLFQPRNDASASTTPFRYYFPCVDST